MSIRFAYEIRKSAGFSLSVDTSIPRTGITVILGPSGCGKTSLLRAIAGLDVVREGECQVGDVIWQSRHHWLPPHKRAVGYVFQAPSLFPHLTAGQNIAYAQKRVRSGLALKSSAAFTSSEVAEVLDIADLLSQYPHQLSGGEQQRVAIARALAVEPQLLLLDEPLAALDGQRKREILPYLEQLRRELQLPMLYVTHSREEAARLADHVLLMSAGQIIAEGVATDVFCRLDVPLIQEPDVGAIIEATVQSHDEHYQLTTLSIPGGRFTIAAIPKPIGSRQRLHILARDVSIALVKPEQNSILNSFPGMVRAIERLDDAQIICQIAIGESLLLAKITHKSADHLQLSVGKLVFAQVKSVAVMG